MAEREFLELEGITKEFPNIKALDGVNFNLRRGEVHAICGENGAGKSTLIKVLGGVYIPEKGKIFIDGKQENFQNPLDAQKAGIGIVHQELSLVSNLSVAENVFANRQPVNKLGLIKTKQLYADTEKILRLFFDEDDKTVTPDMIVEDLSVANRQVVEIMKSLALNPKILVLDEPTSSLTTLEREKLFVNINKLKALGIGCIYISHHLNEVFEIADRVTVLRDGQYVITKDVKDVTEDQLVTYMVGREITDIYGERAPEDKIGEEYFEVKDLYVREMFNNVSFKLRKGEILGISGLVGAGRSEMGMSVFGAIKLNRGEVWLDGKKLDIRSPHDAIKNKIGYMTEDRKEMGLFLEMMIKDNVIAADTYSYSNNALRFIDENLVRKNSDEAVEEFDIATPSITQKVGNLSGGNQQKVLLSMWYGIKPEVLIVDEPTRGVDVGAKSDIYDHLRSLARTGVGIIVISSDLMEILGISDRILVMRGGYLVGELQHDEATEEKVIAIASGVAQ